MSAYKNDYYNKTWNFFTGCDPVSDACKNCVARKKICNLLSKTKNTKSKYNTGFEFTVHSDEELRAGSDSKVIMVNNLSDTFHEKAPFDFLVQKFYQMIENDRHTFIICTKRPHRMAAFVDQYFGDTLLDAPNIILGVSIERRKYLDRLAILNQVQAKRCVFFEPLLEDIGDEYIDLRGIDRVYAGPEVMPFKKYIIKWYSNIKQQCDELNIPFLLTRPMFREGNFHGGDHRKR